MLRARSPRTLGSRRLRRVLAGGVAALVCAASAAADTLVVDDDGGPGVDFADIQPAIAAAAAGDLILVRGGSYSGFTLTAGLTLLGDGQALVRVAGTSSVMELEEGARVVLAGLDLERLEVTRCAGFVLALDLRAGSLEAMLASDLRLQRVATSRTCVLRASRVEAVACDFNGAAGTSSDDRGGDGNPGVLCAQRARVHLALCAARGGKGGDGRGETAQRHGTGGDGGAGVLVAPEHVRLVLAGGGERLEGGDNGLGLFCALDGEPGKGLHLQDHAAGSVWWSDLGFHGGGRLCGGRAGPTWMGAGNTLSPLLPRYATLELVGGGPQQGAVTLRVRAPEGSTARLLLGTEPAVAPLEPALVGLLVEADRSITLGAVPAGGVLDHELLLPDLPTGFLVLAQVSCALPSGQVLLTNSAAFALR